MVRRQAQFDFRIIGSFNPKTAGQVFIVRVVVEVADLVDPVVLEK